MDPSQGSPSRSSSNDDVSHTPPSPRQIAESSDDPQVVIAKLSTELRMEQARTRSLANQITKMKQEQVAMMADAEKQEENITNKLLVRLDILRQEKADLAMKVEQEEEYLTNTLQKKLETLLREKIDLENKLEQEEEYLTNKLQKQLSEVIAEKAIIEKKLHEEIRAHRELQHAKTEVEQLKMQLADYDSKNIELRSDLKKLKTDNFVLQQKVEQEKLKLRDATRTSAELASGQEILFERRFNEAQRPFVDRSKRNRSFSLPPNSPADEENSPSTDKRISSLPTIPETPVSKSPSSRGPVGERRRRMSQGVAAPHPSPRLATNHKVLKAGWLKYKHADTHENMYFQLLENGLLQACPSDNFADPNNIPVFDINMDTVSSLESIPGDVETIVMKTHTSHQGDIHYFKCQSGDDCKEWANWFSMLNPLGDASVKI